MESSFDLATVGTTVVILSHIQYVFESILEVSMEVFIYLFTI